MNKKIIGAVIGIIILAIGLWFWSSVQEAKNAEATPILTDINFFYGQECSHCQEVEKFLADNKIAEKVKFDSVEVWHNNANADVLTQKAQECGIAPDQVGVPFLFAFGKCYVGTPEVENFFKQAAGIQ